MQNVSYIDILTKNTKKKEERYILPKRIKKKSSTKTTKLS